MGHLSHSGIPVTGVQQGCGPRSGPGGWPKAPTGGLRPHPIPSLLPAASSRPLWDSGYALGGGESTVGEGPQRKGAGSMAQRQRQGPQVWPTPSLYLTPLPEAVQGLGSSRAGRASGTFRGRRRPRRGQPWRGATGRREGGAAGPTAWAPTSHLLLQAQDHLHGLLQDEQFGLRLVRLQVQLAHASQLPEGLVNVPHAHPLPRVIGHAPLPVPQVFLLQGQHLLRTAGSQHQASVSHVRAGRGGGAGPGLCRGHCRECVCLPCATSTGTRARGKPRWCACLTMCVLTSKGHDQELFLETFPEDAGSP